MNLIEALKHQAQIDEEGSMVGVSRQAVDEAINRIAELEAENIRVTRSMGAQIQAEFDWRNKCVNLERKMVWLYNQGYHAGHEDTIEGRYVNVHQDDMHTCHDEEVADLVDGK